MSLYNALHGVNPMAPVLLAILGHGGAETYGRFRDIYLDERDGRKVIAVYTRNGGGNRECSGERCDGTCTGCTMTKAIPALDGYIDDRDDDFDCTYATIWFEVPDCARSTLDQLATLINGKTPQDKQREMIDALQSGDKDDPRVAKAMEVLGPVLMKISEKLSS